MTINLIVRLLMPEIAFSFTLNEILLRPNTSTTAMVETVQKYATDYDLKEYLKYKLIRLFGNEVKSPYLSILQTASEFWC